MRAPYGRGPIPYGRKIVFSTVTVGPEGVPARTPQPDGPPPFEAGEIVLTDWESRYEPEPGWRRCTVAGIAWVSTGRTGWRVWVRDGVRCAPDRPGLIFWLDAGWFVPFTSPAAAP